MKKKEGAIHFRDVKAALDTLMILVLRIYYLIFTQSKRFLTSDSKTFLTGATRQ